MEDQLISFLIGVFFSGIFALIVTFIRWIFYIRQRRLLLNLFGIKPGNAQIIAYLSRLQILPGGTIAVGNETIRRGYKGPAINYIEYEGALELRKLLQGDLLILPPDWIIKTLFGDRAYKLLPIELEINTSPLYWKKADFQKALLNNHSYIEPRLTLADIELDLEKLNHYQWKDELGLPDVKEESVEDHANLILIGNSIYNLYTQRYVNSLPFVFKKNETGSRGLFIRAGNIEIPGRGEKYPRELGVIHRRVDKADGQRQPRTVILCAGTGSRATKASALYLAENWRNLANRGEEFTVYLEVIIGQGPDDGEINVEQIMPLDKEIYRLQQEVIRKSD